MIWKIAKRDIGKMVVKIKKDIAVDEDGSMNLGLCSIGTINNFNDDYVYIKFQGDPEAKAQLPKNLEWLDDFNIKGDRITKKELRHAKSKTDTQGQA